MYDHWRWSSALAWRSRLQSLCVQTCDFLEAARERPQIGLCVYMELYVKRRPNGRAACARRIRIRTSPTASAIERARPRAAIPVVPGRSPIGPWYDDSRRPGRRSSSGGSPPASRAAKPPQVQGAGVGGWTSEQAASGSDFKILRGQNTNPSGQLHEAVLPIQGQGSSERACAHPGCPVARGKRICHSQCCRRVA